MKAKFDNEALNTPFFAYVSREEKAEIKKRLDENKSVVIVFEKHDQDLFGAVIDLDEKSLHVREVGGNFLKDWKALDIFCEAFAKLLKKSRISFETRRNAVIRVSGFALYERDGNHFYRAV